MKKVRVSDFDPTAQVPELGSPLDGMPEIGRAPTAASPTEITSPAIPSGRPDGRRRTTRYPFELYQDQIDALKAFSLEEKASGEKGSMSQMVRDALDTYIAARKKGRVG
jgi:hypothetical protein